MTKTASFLAAALMGAALMAPAADALADHRDDRWERRHEDRGWHHHHRHYYRDYGYYGVPAPVYQPYYVPAPPPRVFYQPAYPVYAEPAVTIGVTVPPLVIPLR